MCSAEKAPGGSPTAAVPGQQSIGLLCGKMLSMTRPVLLDGGGCSCSFFERYLLLPLLAAPISNLPNSEQTCCLAEGQTKRSGGSEGVLAGVHLLSWCFRLLAVLCVCMWRFSTLSFITTKTFLNDFLIGTVEYILSLPQTHHVSVNLWTT